MQHINARRIEGMVLEKKHVSLDDLINDDTLDNPYIRKDVALPSKPMEFHVSKVIHVTGRSGLNGILDKSGFQLSSKKKKGWGLLWWGLSIDKDEIDAAEKRFLQELFSNRTPDQARLQEPFLHKLTTSPAFQEGSRYGTFKFTFALSELLNEYSLQFCSNRKPTLRVFKTVVYKQEIMHVVLVHDPHVKDFDSYPELQDNGQNVCALQGEHMVWRPRAISETHKFFLRGGYNSVSLDELPGTIFFVWEHVSLAFHVEVNKMLNFCEEKLLRNLTACTPLEPYLCHDPEKISLDEARAEVEEQKRRRNLQ